MNSFIRQRLFGKFDGIYVLNQPPSIQITHVRELSCHKMNVYTMSKHPNIGFVHIIQQTLPNVKQPYQHFPHILPK